MQLKVVKVIKNPSGKIYINFSDGSQLEANSLDELKNSCLSLDLDPDLAKRIAVGYWLSQDTTASNTSLVEGKTLNISYSNLAVLSKEEML